MKTLALFHTNGNKIKYAKREIDAYYSALKAYTTRRAVQVSNKISRATQLHVSSSVLLIIRTLTTSHIKLDNNVTVPKGLNIKVKSLARNI